MSSPILVGTTAIIVAPPKASRNKIRFQNTGSSIIYLKKIPEGEITPVSPTNYEVLLRPFAINVSSSNPSVAVGNNGNGNDNGNDNGNHDVTVQISLEGDPFETDSVLGFQAISSSSGGILAIYETVNVS